MVIESAEKIKDSLHTILTGTIRVGLRIVEVLWASVVLDRVPLLKAAFQGATATIIILTPAMVLCMLLKMPIPWIRGMLIWLMLVILGILAGNVDELRKGRDF